MLSIVKCPVVQRTHLDRGAALRQIVIILLRTHQSAIRVCRIIGFVAIIASVNPTVITLSVYFPVVAPVLRDSGL